jgi:hypothetical protein
MSPRDLPTGFEGMNGSELNQRRTYAGGVVPE